MDDTKLKLAKAVQSALHDRLANRVSVEGLALVMTDNSDTPLLTTFTVRTPQGSRYFSIKMTEHY